MSRSKQREIQNDIFKPLELSTWGLVLFGLVVTGFLPITVDKPKIFGWLVFTAIYAVFFYRWVFPRYRRAPWLTFVPTLVNIALVAVFDYFLGTILNIELIYPAIIVGIAIRVGLRPAILAALLATLADYVVDYARSADFTSFLVLPGFNPLIYLLVAYLAGSLAATIRRQSIELTRHNQDLALLVETSNVSAASQDLESDLSGLAERIAKGLSCTLCSVSLIHSDNAELILVGVYPQRPLNDSSPRIEQRRTLDGLPRHRKAIELRQPIILRQEVSEMAMDAKEYAQTLYPGMASACLVPMVVEDRAVGIIAVGEARSWEQQPFDQAKINLLQSIAAQAAASVNNVHLHQSLQHQLDRMAVVNEVTRAITSTIEMDQLLELIYQQLLRVISAETYYVALHEIESNTIDMRVIIDDGERFPPMHVPYGEGLASYVIQERKPLLIHHLSMELESLPIKPRIIGQDKVSESWLGVPIIVSDHLIGVLVVASYHPNVFDEEDVALLTTVASQAAIALDNARHHALVEEQARRDSLTGVYNHGFLLSRLNDEVARARQADHPVSLIMLDIDYFKAYNDQFGHVMGDEVLRLVGQAIQAHVKPTDIVGRWGGEEFGVVLPKATTGQARSVAVRIRQTLLNLPLMEKERQAIPKPTVSQGIATFPDHAADANELIELADQTLYKAKALGRDLVIVAPPRAW